MERLLQDGAEANERMDRWHAYPLEIPWHDRAQVHALEARLRTENMVGIAEKDGSLKVMPMKEFVPNHVFTAKWNSAQIEIPFGTHAGIYNDPLPIDWSLTPNPKDRLTLNDVELHRGVKYAVEGETGIMAEVTETGLKITHVGPYQDMSDRDVSPAGKTWGNGTIAGMGPLWIAVDDWDELEGAQLNANIVGFKSEEVDGEAPHIVTIPADINMLAKYWREELAAKLMEHPVYKDAKLKPGEKIIFTTGLLYWEQDYEVRYFRTDVTPDIQMEVTLTLMDGREVQSVMRAHTIDRPVAKANESQNRAINIWENTKSVKEAPTRTQPAPEGLAESYAVDRASQQTKGKLEKLVSVEGFSVGENPNTDDMREMLPTISQLRQRYEAIVSDWPEGAGVDLMLVRSGTGISESKGILTGVIDGPDGNPIDDTILKRSAQRAYDVGSLLWNEPAPDLLIASGSTTSMATLEIAMYGIGEPFPSSQIQRDWRLNERSFGKGIGRPASDFSPEELHSFENSLPNGENFAYVHLKTISFMLDLMESAKEFYETEQRPMRVVVATHEGPMQIMKAVLDGKKQTDDIFRPIESTHSERVVLTKPFEWPGYISDKALCNIISSDECASALKERKEDLTDADILQAATRLLTYRLSHIHTEEGVKTAIDDSLSFLESRQAHPNHILLIIDDLVRTIGHRKILPVISQLQRIISNDGLLDISSKDGISIISALDGIAFAARSSEFTRPGMRVN